MVVSIRKDFAADEVRVYGMLGSSIMSCNIKKGHIHDVGFDLLTVFTLSLIYAMDVEVPILIG